MNQSNPPRPDTLEADKPETAAAEQAVQHPSEKAEAQVETTESGISKEENKKAEQAAEPQPLAHPTAIPPGKA